ncbi:lysoplasmalogenase [Leucobacter insecticola]|uniref:Lysoplasmalogenase n=2 Tax=Leucobacter insecticola TaxID=2714934 RepID=A0A6G8FMM9_9MICO|nr:lysoplasmalogenase [Leucobacter insecticola]
MQTPGRLLTPFLPYSLVSILHVCARFLEHPIAEPTKLWLMPALALAAVWASATIRPWPRGAMALLLGAVVFSWLGDGAAAFFPMFEDELPMMLLCFGLAHVGYLVLMWRARGVAVRGFPLWALIYLAAYVVLLVLLLPRTGTLSVPVAIYGLLLVGTAAMASRCGPVVAWGGAWFLVSDGILAFRIFTPELMPDWTSGLVMLTYTLGQGLIVCGIIRALEQREGAAAGS